MERKDDHALADVVDQLWKVTDDYWEALVKRDGKLEAFQIGRPAFEFLRKNSKYKKYERTRERDTFLFMMNCASRPTLDGRFVNELVGTKRSSSGVSMTVTIPPSGTDEEVTDHETSGADKHPAQSTLSGFDDISEEEGSPPRKVICREEDDAITRDVSQSDRFSNDGSGDGEGAEELRAKALESLAKSAKSSGRRSGRHGVFDRLGEKGHRS